MTALVLAAPAAALGPDPVLGLCQVFPGPPPTLSPRAPSLAWDLRSTALRPEGWTSADAAGLPIFPGLVRYEEVAAGRLEHAIRVTFESTRDAWVRPATHCAGDTVSPSAPPMGRPSLLSASASMTHCIID
jgi:hypothetical protein